MGHIQIVEIIIPRAIIGIVIMPVLGLISNVMEIVQQRGWSVEMITAFVMGHIQIVAIITTLKFF